MMKIQLIEAFQGGHHTNYIEALLPTLRTFLQRGQISEAVITITQKHYNLLVHQGVAKKEEVNLHFKATLPEVNPNPKLQDRLRLFDSINASVKEVCSDAIICTSADYDVMFNALLHKKANFGGALGPRAVGVFHYGYPKNESLTWKEKIKQKIYETSWQHATWNRFLFVNPMVYEGIIQTEGIFASKITLLPDPVPTKINMESAEARERLNIPSDGIYIGFVGMMDNRKAIPEILASFVNSKAYESSRLLLAGLLAEEYHQLIYEKYSHLVNNQRIILINRHLTNDEIQLGYAAVDVHALLQYRRMNLSANLLKAVAYGKPILVDSCGYTGMMANRFALGSTCDVNDLESISKAMVQAIELASNFKPSIQSSRLLQFHNPDNYANTVMSELLNSKNDAKNLDIYTWDWVCESNKSTNKKY